MPPRNGGEGVVEVGGIVRWGLHCEKKYHCASARKTGDAMYNFT